MGAEVVDVVVGMEDGLGVVGEDVVGSDVGEFVVGETVGDVEGDSVVEGIGLLDGL